MEEGKSSQKTFKDGIWSINRACLNWQTTILKNIIFIICKSTSKKMSYLTVTPNCYYRNGNQMNQVVNQYVLNQNLFNTQNILSYLKTALTISLNNYQQNYHTPSPQSSTTISETKIDNTTQEISPKAFELLQSHEENKEISHIDTQLEKKVTNDTVIVVEDRESRKDPVTLTDDQFHLEDKQKTAKKSQPQKKRGKKVKEDVACDFVVPIPEVDLIETAYLPLFAQRADLARKRDELLMRKVGDWSQFCKGKKDKRQIRMLSN